MQVSSQMNSYQVANIYQQSQQEIQPIDPIRTDPRQPIEEEKPLSSEEQLKLDQELQTQKDAQKEYAAGYISHQSKQTQVAIYMSVEDGGNNQNLNNTSTILESLKDVQKQNDALNAYAIYSENQKNATPTPY